MNKLTEYGWIFGLLCIPAGILNLWMYLTSIGDIFNFIAGIFALCSATFNLTVYGVILGR